MTSETPKKRSQLLRIRVSDDELELIKDAAKSVGLGASTWMRVTCIAAAKREKRRAD